jgi:outer membrane protein assembly factor BamB
VESPEQILNAFQPHPNGQYTLNNAVDTVAGFRVLDELGRNLGRLTCVNRPTRFHEVRILAGGDYWVMCNDTRVMDLTGLGGQSSVSTVWTVIQHVSAQGAVLFEWDSFEHFDIADNPLNNIANLTSVNVTHGNALAPSPDGNLIVSFRELGEITKIDTSTGDVIWRFGGLANEFTILNDSKGSFERQHGLVVLDNGDIQFLDNGDVAPSRLVRYRIDDQAMTADLIMEFIDAPTTHTLVGGNTQAYANGGALVSFGRAGRVVETTGTGARAWELTGIDSIYVFRVQRIPSLYSAKLGEPVP